MRFTVVYQPGFASWISNKTTSERLNSELIKIQKEGTQVISVTPVFNFLGMIIAYMLLLETDINQ